MKLKLHGMAGILLTVAGACALVQDLQAGSFVDNSRDLILTFRKTGFDGSGDVGNYVVEVDIGQASIYYGATKGSTIPITAYNAATELGVFDSLNDMSWSVCGCVPNAGDSGDASKPTSTLWVSDPSSSPYMQATPWLCSSSYEQGNADAHIVAILDNAQTFGASVANSSTDTSTALAIPAGNGDNASGSLGALGNFAGTFYGNGLGQADVENTTSPTFTTDGVPSRCDLYELQPSASFYSNPEGTYLGYFELATNGALTFYAQSFPAPALSVSTAGNNVVISFPSAVNGTYTLHYTNTAGLAAPISTWSTVSTNIVGNGSVQSFSQPISGAGTYFGVSVH